MRPEHRPLEGSQVHLISRRPQSGPRTCWRVYMSRLASGSCQWRWRTLLRRGTSGLACWTCYHREPTPNNWKIMDGWIIERVITDLVSSWIVLKTSLIIVVYGENGFWASGIFRWMWIIVPLEGPISRSHCCMNEDLYSSSWLFSLCTEVLTQQTGAVLNVCHVGVTVIIIFPLFIALTSTSKEQVRVGKFNVSWSSSTKSKVVKLIENLFLVHWTDQSHQTPAIKQCFLLLWLGWGQVQGEVAKGKQLPYWGVVNNIITVTAAWTSVISHAEWSVCSLCVDFLSHWWYVNYSSTTVGNARLSSIILLPSGDGANRLFRFRPSVWQASSASWLSTEVSFSYTMTWLLNPEFFLFAQTVLCKILFNLVIMLARE